MNRLSPRQRDVLRELLRGCCIESAAARIGIAVGTAKVHRNALYQRLGVNSQAQLMGQYTRPTDEAQRLIEGGE